MPFKHAGLLNVNASMNQPCDGLAASLGCTTPPAQCQLGLAPASESPSGYVGKANGWMDAFHLAKLAPLSHVLVASLSSDTDARCWYTFSVSPASF